MRPIATYVARSVACLCVGHADESCKNNWTDWGAILRRAYSRLLNMGGAPWRWRHLTNTVNDPCAMAIRPYVKLLWSLVTERPDGLITPQTWHRIQLCNFTTFGVNDIWNKNYYHWYLGPEAIYMVSSWVHLNFSRQLAALQPCKSNTTFTPAPQLNAPRRAAPCVF